MQAAPQVEARQWRSCCLTMDRGAALFCTQALISAGTIGLCTYQLINLENCEAQSLYSGVLTLILGAWLPTPKMTT